MEEFNEFIENWFVNYPSHVYTATTIFIIAIIIFLVFLTLSKLIPYGTLKNQVLHENGLLFISWQTFYLYITMVAIYMIGFLLGFVTSYISWLIKLPKVPIYYYGILNIVLLFIPTTLIVNYRYNKIKSSKYFIGENWILLKTNTHIALIPYKSIINVDCDYEHEVIKFTFKVRHFNLINNYPRKTISFNDKLLFLDFIKNLKERQIKINEKNLKTNFRSRFYYCFYFLFFVNENMIFDELSKLPVKLQKLLILKDEPSHP